jgi:hypothetical protein
MENAAGIGMVTSEIEARARELAAINGLLLPNRPVGPTEVTKGVSM